MPLSAITNLQVVKQSDGTYTATWDVDTPADVYMVSINGTLSATTPTNTMTGLQLFPGDKLSITAEATSPSDVFTVPQTPPPPTGMKLFSYGPLPTATQAQYLKTLKGLYGISVTSTAKQFTQSYKGPISFALYDQASQLASSIAKKLYFRSHFGDGCPADLPGQVTLPGSCFSSGPTTPPSVTLPFPTDTTYQSFVDYFIAAIGGHVNGDPVLEFFGMSGPSRQGEMTEPICSQWTTLCQQRGLTSAVLASIWAHDIDEYRRWFPSHVTTLGMENPMGILNGLLTAIKTAHGTDMILCQQNGLRGTTDPTNANSWWKQAQALGFKIGAQTWGSVLQGSGPFETELSVGKALGLDTIELYASDVLNPANAALIAQYGAGY